MNSARPRPRSRLLPALLLPLFAATSPAAETPAKLALLQEEYAGARVEQQRAAAERYRSELGGLERKFKRLSLAGNARQAAVELARVKEDLEALGEGGLRLTTSKPPDPDAPGQVHSAWKKYDAERTAALERLEGEHEAALEKLKKDFIGEDDLDSAVAVNNALKALRAGEPGVAQGGGGAPDPDRLTLGEGGGEDEGDAGRGSGFVLQIRGKTFVATNLHVLAGNESFKIKRMDGKELPRSGIFGAVGYDFAIIRVPDQEDFLLPVDDLAESFKEGDPILVSGNSMGAGVATSIRGKIEAIGPTLVEVDAKFASGNSGSPIIGRGGRVLGIATFTSEYDLESLEKRDKEAEVKKTRWFGYRVDNVPQWEPIRWKTFVRQSKGMAKIEGLTDDFVAFLQGENYSSRELRQIRRTLDERFSRNQGRDFYLQAFKQYVTRLRFLATDDVEKFLKTRLYSYFREQAEEHQSFRERVQELMIEVAQDLERQR